MAQRKVLVGEGAGPVDAGGAGAVAVQEVAALDHEVFDLRTDRSPVSMGFALLCGLGLGIRCKGGEIGV